MEPGKRGATLSRRVAAMRVALCADGFTSLSSAPRPRPQGLQRLKAHGIYGEKWPWTRNCLITFVGKIDAQGELPAGNAEPPHWAAQALCPRCHSEKSPCSCAGSSEPQNNRTGGPEQTSAPSPCS